MKSIRCNFLGRVEAFRELVLSYDFAINPSRMETFGMAAIEVLAAGVPLLSTRTGIIEQVLEPGEMLVPPHDPLRLTAALKYIIENWNKLNFGVEAAQSNIRTNFLVDKAARLLDDEYKSLNENKAAPNYSTMSKASGVPRLSARAALRPRISSKCLGARP